MSRSAGTPRPRNEPALPTIADRDETPDAAAPVGGPEDRSTLPTKSVRASAAEREATVRVLHDALGQGRLDLAETETRVAAAYAAVLRADLPPLTADLPRREQGSWSGSGIPTWQTVWVGLLWRVRASLWDSPGHARLRPPGPAEQRLAVLALVFAGLWLMVWAVIGAAL